MVKLELSRMAQNKKETKKNYKRTEKQKLEVSKEEIIRSRASEKEKKRGSGGDRSEGG